MLANKNSRRFSQDTYENKYTKEAAYLSAGSTCQTLRSINAGSIDTAFAIVRPPGHHSGIHSICGFCFFNNVAVAARVA